MPNKAVDTDALAARYRMPMVRRSPLRYPFKRVCRSHFGLNGTLRRPRPTQRNGISFEEAASVFEDELAYTFPDPDHSVGERRHLTFGISYAGRLLAVISTERPGGLRVISARKATRRERGIYEQG